MGFICPLTGWQTQSHQQLSASVIGCIPFTAFSFTVYCARCWPCESLWMGSSNQMPVGCAYETNVSCQWAISSVYCLLFVVKLPNNWNCWSTGSACPALPACQGRCDPFVLFSVRFYAWQFHFLTTKLPEIEQFRPVIEHRPTTCCQAWTLFDVCVCVREGGERRIGT